MTKIELNSVTKASYLITFVIFMFVNINYLMIEFWILDDWNMVEWLNGKDFLPLNQAIIHLEQSLKRYGSYPRFTPIYDLSLGLRASIFGNLAFLWYSFNFLLLTLTFFFAYKAANIQMNTNNKFFGNTVPLSFAIIMTTNPILPSAYGRLGTPEPILYFCAIALIYSCLNKEKKGTMVLFLSSILLIISMGVKENGIFLFAFWLIIWRRNSSKMVMKIFSLSLVLVFGLFILGGFIPAILKNGHDIYNKPLSIFDRISGMSEIRMSIFLIFGFIMTLFIYLNFSKITSETKLISIFLLVGCLFEYLFFAGNLSGHYRCLSFIYVAYLSLIALSICLQNVKLRQSSGIMFNGILLILVFLSVEKTRDEIEIRRMNSEVFQKSIEDISQVLKRPGAHEQTIVLIPQKGADLELIRSTVVYVRDVAPNLKFFILSDFRNEKGFALYLQGLIRQMEEFGSLEYGISARSELPFMHKSTCIAWEETGAIDKSGNCNTSILIRWKIN
jgi:hypothetical protein